MVCAWCTMRNWQAYIWKVGLYYIPTNMQTVCGTRCSCVYIISSFWILWSWWRHQMETFSALLATCAGNSPVPGEFPAQRPVMRSFDVFFDMRPNKRLSKQSWGWWFETPSRSLWRHCNVLTVYFRAVGVTHNSLKNSATAYIFEIRIVVNVQIYLEPSNV